MLLGVGTGLGAENNPQLTVGGSMTMTRIAALLLPALTLLGPVHAYGKTTLRLSRDRFAVAQDAMVGSAALRRSVEQGCISRMRAMPHAKLANIAIVLDTSPEQAPALACGRMIAAIASGRMTYDDLSAARSGHPSVKVLRILQGR
jgi:hypothetical protein